MAPLLSVEGERDKAHEAISIFLEGGRQLPPDTPPDEIRSFAQNLGKDALRLGTELANERRKRREEVKASLESTRIGIADIQASNQAPDVKAAAIRRLELTHRRRAKQLQRDEAEAVIRGYMTTNGYSLLQPVNPFFSDED